MLVRAQAWHRRSHHLIAYVRYTLFMGVIKLNRRNVVWLGADVHTPIGLLRKRAATLAGGLARFFGGVTALLAMVCAGLVKKAFFLLDRFKQVFYTVV